MREREANQRASETENEREHRLAATREREANWRASETDNEREHRLAVMRERLTNVPVRQRMKGSIDWQLQERDTASNVWWNNVVLRTFNQQDWLDNFRMSKETFLYICSKLSPALARTDTLMRKCLSVERRVAVTIWSLATPIEYRTIAHLFGIARSTVCEIVHETCRCIVDVLLKEYIKFPTNNRLSTVVEEFKTKWGVPQCFGAIDGCHIPISAPNLMHTDYYNRKRWYSMLIQGVVDANYRFLDVCVGWPGSVHDARVFAQSTLYDNIEHHHILPNNTITVSGVRIPLYLIGDSAYPLKLWLMKPFAHNTDLTSDQRNYNYRICRARITVEIAFGRLKGR
ncbi:uncharacterized protein [Dysidea avara]|uniref:uncharacterized protein n=1 Tax=Dysidea avara TaxID=196820 RepID=UPI00332A9BDA